jgi:hypothetical protein
MCSSRGCLLTTVHDALQQESFNRIAHQDACPFFHAPGHGPGGAPAISSCFWTTLSSADVELSTE